MRDGLERSHPDPTGDGFYADALVYDVLHAAGTAEECATLRTVADEFAPRKGWWIEPACGTGRHGRWLAKRYGVRSVGIDLAEPMIEDARRRAARAGIERDARFVLADMTSFVDALPRGVPGRAVFAFTLINSIRHLVSERQLATHFDEMARTLAPHGRYAVGLHTAAYGVEVPTDDRFVGGRGRLRVEQRVRYLPATGPRDRVERVQSEVTVSGGSRGGSGTGSGSGVRRSEYALRAYSPAEWIGAVRRAGWRVEAVLEESGAPIALDARGRPTPGAYALWVLSPPTGSRSRG